MSRNLTILNEAFAELHPPLDENEAAAAAARCLFCYDAPCTRACPTHIDIPQFIRQILDRDLRGAARTILDANILGGSCARACPTEVLCEGACVENILHDAPVLIGRLQRYACDRADGAAFYAPGPDSGKRVAIIGSGPAGLSCAHELRKRGHAVEIFEAAEMPGGLNTYGIAAYKISTEFALSEVELVRAMGVTIHLRRPVNGAAISELLAQYDAVFLAVGLGKTASPKIPGENAKGVWESLAFIAQTHTAPIEQCEVGRRVIVIGGGNTAIDAANAAVRLGAAHVTIAYRRDAVSMPAFAHEYEEAQRSGVQFEWNAIPTRIFEENGQATGVEFARTTMTGAGRAAKLAPTPGSAFVIPADMVILALGQERRTDLLSQISKLALTPDGRIAVNPETLETSVARLFAGGDCRAGAREEIVYAVQDGKIAAAGIDRVVAEKSEVRR